MHVVVIGAGSIGTQVAYRLTEQGAQVTLVEAAEPGRGTSSASFCWLSTFPQLGWEEEPGRAKLRPEVHGYWRRLEDEVGDTFVDWCGTLTIADGEEAEDLTYRAEVAQGKGVDVAVVGAGELREIEPLARMHDGDTAFFQRDSGWVDVPKLISALIKRAQHGGMRLITGTAVVAVDTADQRARSVTLTNGETIACDAIVNAAGSWGTHISAMAGLTIPLDLKPGRIITTEPLPAEIRPKVIVNSPIWGARNEPGGGLAINARGGLPSGKGHARNIGQVGDLRDSLAHYIPGLAEVEIAYTRVGIRPIPADGPIVGALPWLPNLYLTVSHGGIGWAPVWGWMAARELLHGETVPELSAMRPLRFHKGADELGRHADDAEQVAPVP